MRIIAIIEPFETHPKDAAFVLIYPEGRKLGSRNQYTHRNMFVVQNVYRTSCTERELKHRLELAASLARCIRKAYVGRS